MASVFVDSCARCCPVFLSQEWEWSQARPQGHVLDVSGEIAGNLPHRVAVAQARRDLGGFHSQSCCSATILHLFRKCSLN